MYITWVIFIFYWKLFLFFNVFNFFLMFYYGSCPTMDFPFLLILALSFEDLYEQKEKQISYSSSLNFQF